MPFKAVLRVINMFLGIGAFLAVGTMSLTAGEEFFWAAGKAFVAFIICWMVLGWLLNLLAASIVGEEEDSRAKTKASKNEKGASAAE